MRPQNLTVLFSGSLLFLAVAVSISCSDDRGPATIALAARISGYPTVTVAQAVADSVGGHPLRFHLDTVIVGVEPETELARALTFLEQEVFVGVVGPAGSRAALVTAPLFNENQVLQIVPTGTSRRLAEAGPWTLTLAANDSIEGAVIGGFVADSLQARRVLLFYLTDEYGYGLRDGVTAALQERGIEILDAAP
jgi:branched-chain amino acid transport system substrate-binding protein